VISRSPGDVVNRLVERINPAFRTAANTGIYMVTKRTLERNEQKGAALLEGDVVLRLNRKDVTKIPDLDVMYSHEQLDAVIMRDCNELVIQLSTVAADDVETDRAVSFCSAIFHDWRRATLPSTNYGLHEEKRHKGVARSVGGSVAPVNIEQMGGG